MTTIKNMTCFRKPSIIIRPLKRKCQTLLRLELFNEDFVFLPNLFKELTHPSFHSLQTGKCISRVMEIAKDVQVSCFHSLQTGKRITSIAIQLGVPPTLQVSIPFKRESVSQVQAIVDVDKIEKQFPFPSNGKAYHKCTTGAMCMSIPMTVSIPFKRESVSQAYDASQRGS